MWPERPDEGWMGCNFSLLDLPVEQVLYTPRSRVYEYITDVDENEPVKHVSEDLMHEVLEDGT